MSDLFRIRIPPEIQRMTTRQLAARIHETEGVDDVAFMEAWGEVERRHNDPELRRIFGGYERFMMHYRELWPQYAKEAKRPDGN